MSTVTAKKYKYDVDERHSKFRGVTVCGYHNRWMRRNKIKINLSGMVQQMLDEIMLECGDLTPEQMAESRKHYKISRYAVTVHRQDHTH